MSQRILIVNDDPAALGLLRRCMADAGFDVLSASSSAEAVRAAISESPSIVIAALSPLASEGLKLCRMLRSTENDKSRAVHVILLAARSEMNYLAEALDAGADDFLTAPVEREELLTRIRIGQRAAQTKVELALRNNKIAQLKAEAAVVNQQLAEAGEKLQRLSSIDDLSGLMNRREGMQQLRMLWASQDRYGHPFACLVIDIDQFEKVNDTYGAAVGDRALRDLSRVIRRNVRKTDIVCRLGGEEFLVLCPHVSANEAAVCAEHLRTAISQHAFVNEGICLQLTVCIGVAERTSSLSGPEDLLRLADRAMHESKRNGRNRVMVAGPAMILGGSRKTPASPPARR